MRDITTTLLIMLVALSMVPLLIPRVPRRVDLLARMLVLAALVASFFWRIRAPISASLDIALGLGGAVLVAVLLGIVMIRKARAGRETVPEDQSLKGSSTR